LCIRITYIKGGVPLHWFSGGGGGSWLPVWRFLWFFFAIRHDFVHIFRKFSKIRSFLLSWPVPPLGDQKKINHGEWYIKWKVMTSVFDLLIF
jgi:hypothetical protein